MKRASELQPGDRIRLEYGDYNNFVNFTVNEVREQGACVLVSCIAGPIQERFPMRKEELVEVLE